MHSVVSVCMYIVYLYVHVCQQKTVCLLPYHLKISHQVYSTTFSLSKNASSVCGLLCPASYTDRAIHTFLLEQWGPLAPEYCITVLKARVLRIIQCISFTAISL